MSIVVPSKFTDLSVEIRLEYYRDLLDRWEMWEERAHLDISLSKFRQAEKAKVVVRCNYCGQPIIHGSTSRRRGGLGRFSRLSGIEIQEDKPTRCQHCRKPLPKCSVCLMSFGSSLHSLGDQK